MVGIGIPQADADEFTSKVYGALFMSDVALYRMSSYHSLFPRSHYHYHREHVIMVMAIWYMYVI